MINLENIYFSYGTRHDNGEPLFHDLNLKIRQGEYVCVAGSNGAGKSTLASMIKGLISPEAGRVLYDGNDVTGKGVNYKIGYIFSNPENQIVSPVVEDDVAFGPENQGKNTDEILDVVKRSLHKCGTYFLRKKLSHQLSGGEMQKVNMAGILSMNVETIILDEAVSMIEPHFRMELLEMMKKMNKEDGVTIIHISHNLADMLSSDRMFVLSDGEIVFDDVSSKLLYDGECLELLGLSNSSELKFIRALLEKNIISDLDVKCLDSVVEAILSFSKGSELKG